jgi:predicted dehydrogenase
MADTLKVGVTGLGGLGTNLARDVSETGEANVVAVTDVDESNRSRAGEEFDISADRQFADHATMLETVDLDGVVIATPHTIHYDQVAAALDRDVDVLCEKPLCTDIDHAKDLVRRSDRSEATVMVGYQRHLDGAFRRARAEMADQVGDPQFLTAEITQDWIENQSSGSWRLDPDLSGGGQLYDTGSHLLDVVLWTTGLTPTAVNAQMLFHDDDQRVDKQAGLDITFDNGAVATVAVSGDTPSVREHFHVWGRDGGMYIDGEGWAARDLTYVDTDGGSGEERQVSTDDFAGGQKVKRFVEMVRNGRDPPATVRDALRVTAVTEAAYESARTGQRVEISLSDADTE